MRSVPFSCLVFFVHVRRLGRDFSLGPHRKRNGSRPAHLLFSRAGGVFFVSSLFSRICRQCTVSTHSRGQVGPSSTMLRRIGCDLCVNRADHWPLVGQTHLGSLLAMGAAPDLNADYFYHLCGLPNGAGIWGAL